MSAYDNGCTKHKVSTFSLDIVVAHHWVCFAIFGDFFFLSMVALGATSKYPSSAMNASGINNITRIAFVLKTYIFHLLLSIVC